MDLRAAAMARIDSLYGRDSYQAAMMQAVLLGSSFRCKGVDRRLPLHRHFSHAGNLGNSRGHRGGFRLFRIAAVLRSGEPGAALTAAVAWLYALVTGFNAPCVRSAAALTLVIAAGHFFSPEAALEPAGRGGARLSAGRSGSIVRRQFPVELSCRGVFGRVCDAADPRHFGSLGRGLSELASRDRDINLEPRVAQFRIEMRLLAETRTVLFDSPWVRLPGRGGGRADAVLPL